MISKMIEGHTRVIGKSQGYMGLAVKDTVVEGTDVPCMETHWEPTPDELRRMRNGKPVKITILGDTHPPIKVGVV